MMAAEGIVVTQVIALGSAVPNELTESVTLFSCTRFH